MASACARQTVFSAQRANLHQSPGARNPFRRGVLAKNFPLRRERRTLYIARADRPSALPSAPTKSPLFISECFPGGVREKTSFNERYCCRCYYRDPLLTPRVSPFKPVSLAFAFRDVLGGSHETTDFEDLGDGGLEGLEFMK